MKKPSPLTRLLVRLGILVAIIAVVSVGIAVSPLGDMFGSMISVTRDHESLKTRIDAHELGALMIDVLRDPLITTEDIVSGDDERLPARLRELGVSALLLDRNKGMAQLELGGGFYHYGYEVQAEGADAYRMVCYGENEDEIEELGTFKYNKTENKAEIATPRTLPGPVLCH